MRLVYNKSDSMIFREDNAFFKLDMKGSHELVSISDKDAILEVVKPYLLGGDYNIVEIACNLILSEEETHETNN